MPIDYIAPEQIEGKEVNGRADLYALACVLFEALTGSIPFSKNNEVAVLWAHLQEAPPRLTDLRPDLAAGLDPVMSKALAKSPDDRYATASEFLAAARRALREPPATLEGPDLGDRGAPLTAPTSDQSPVAPGTHLRIPPSGPGRRRLPSHR